MAETINYEAAYVPPNVALMMNEWKHGADSGLSSRIEAMDRHFRWKPGFINGWYGWPNDGKGTMFDYLAVVSAKLDNQKFGLFKREDMGTYRAKDGTVIVNANDIYNNLIWTYTGKTPYRHIHEKYSIPLLTSKEYMAAEEWVREYFYVINPPDRRHVAILEYFSFYISKYKLNHVLIDPWKSVVIREAKGRTKDEILHMEFDDSKKLAEQYYVSVNYIAHPKSMTEVRVSRKEDARFKIVTQYDVAGGAAFDNSMDSQYSIYRPERHISMTDPKVWFINLKQRKAEQLGVYRGEVKGIEFDWTTKSYFFNGINPLTGAIKQSAFEKASGPMQGSIFDVTESKGKETVKGDMPF